MSKRLVTAAKIEQRLAAVKGNEWDSESSGEEEAAEDNMIALPEAKPIESGRKRAKAVSSTSDGLSSVVYVGHIPHGFYEEQMRGFFSQFGDVERVRLSRSKKTGGSKGYAFVEFKDVEDTKIVAESMDKYILSGKQLVVKQLPLSKIHPRIWKGSDKKFQAYPMRKQHAERVNKTKTASAQKLNNDRLGKSETKKRKKLADLGIEYDFPGYTALLPNKEAQSIPEPEPLSISSAPVKKAKTSKVAATPKQQEEAAIAPKSTKKQAAPKSSSKAK